MSASFQKVRSGEPLVIPAGTFNAMLDATADYEHRKHDIGRGGQPGGGASRSICRVKNTGATLIPAFGAISLTGVIITPTANLSEFQQNFSFTGTVPATTDTSRFAVPIEPIPAGSIGRAVFAGLCAVKLNVTDATHQFADVANAHSDYLASGSSGMAQILYKEAGTGTKWAVVRLGGGGGADNVIVVKVTAAATGGGKYYGRSCAGTSSAAAAGNLALPEGLTVASSDDCLVLNADEDGLTTHSLILNSFHIGRVIGATVEATPKKVVVVRTTNSLALPAGGSQYQVLQRNATGQAIWDWVRVH